MSYLIDTNIIPEVRKGALRRLCIRLVCVCC